MRVFELMDSTAEYTIYKPDGSAVHKGELASIPATGKTITIRMFTMLRLAQGKIAEEWEIFDELGVMQQLGAIPEHS